MNSFTSTNSLVTQVFDSGSEKNAIYHNRFTHARNAIPSDIEVPAKRTCMSLGDDDSSTDNKKQRRYEEHCMKVINIYLGNNTDGSIEDRPIGVSNEDKEEKATELDDDVAEEADVAEEDDEEDVAEEDDEDDEDKEDEEDDEDGEDNENENGVVENERTVKVESSDDDDTYDHWDVWNLSNAYETRIKDLESENEELRGEVELARTNLAEARTIISNLKGYVSNMKDIKM